MRDNRDNLNLCEKCRTRKPRSDYRKGRGGRRIRYCAECQDRIASACAERRKFVLSPECRDLHRKRALLVTLGKHNRKSMATIKAEALMRKADRGARQIATRAYARWMRSLEKQFQKTDPEVVENRRRASRLRYHGSSNEKKEESKARYYANIESERLRSTLYKHTHPHVTARWNEKRKQIAFRLADGSLTHDVCGKLFSAAKRCPYCERKISTENKALDHMVPLSKGGAHGIHNVLICCRDCNLRKRNMSFSEWCSTLSASCEKRARKIYRQRHGVEPEQKEMELRYA